MLFTALATLAASTVLASPNAVRPRAQPTIPTAQAVLVEMNAIRGARALVPMRTSWQLTAAAAEHSGEMGRRGYFEHESFDGTAFSTRVARYYGPKGYRSWSVGENLLWGAGPLTGRAVVIGWMKSPPHRRNLLDPRWRHVGISVKHFQSAPGIFRGLDVTVVTADFGNRR